jgi:hypothetical protein
MQRTRRIASFCVDCAGLLCECGSGSEIGPEDGADGSQAATTTCGPFNYRGPRGQVFVRGVVTGGEDMDEKSSWMRVAITIAIDWRFITALVVLVLAPLLK